MILSSSTTYLHLFLWEMFISYARGKEIDINHYLGLDGCEGFNKNYQGISSLYTW